MPVDDINQAIATAEAELADLDARRAAIAERLSALEEQRTARPPVMADRDGSDEWSASRKVELFRSLFRRRDDVFAVRWGERREAASRLRAALRERVARHLREAARQVRRVPEPGVPPRGLFRCARLPTGPSKSWASTRCSRTRRAGCLAIYLDGKAWREDVAAVWHACRRAGARTRSRALPIGRRGTPLVLLRLARPGCGRSRARRAAPHSCHVALRLARDGSLRQAVPQPGHPAGGRFGNLIALPVQRIAREQQNMPIAWKGTVVQYALRPLRHSRGMPSDRAIRQHQHQHNRREVGPLQASAVGPVRTAAPIC